MKVTDGTNMQREGGEMSGVEIIIGLGIVCSAVLVACKWKQ
jgi:hypothetical protein